ncbi:MAG: hypothetical protein WA885_18945 [Phormidesmis sp.]
MPPVSKLDQVLESIEVLSFEDQEMLIDLVHRRLVERRRDEIAKHIAQAEKDHKTNRVFRGTVEDAIAELNLSDTSQSKEAGFTETSNNQHLPKS